MNISTAKQIDLVEFLAHEEYKPKRSKGHNHWYLSPIRTESTPSFKVDSNRNEWYDYGLGKGGDIIDLGMYLYGVSTVSDVLRCLEEKATTIANRIYRCKDIQPVRQEPNEMHNIQYVPLTHPALLSYMMKRHIDINLGRVYCCEVHYNLRGGHYFGIAFINRIGGYEIRNPFFKGCIGHKDISLIPQRKDQVREHCCLFEGFMDFLSYLTLLDKNSRMCVEAECDYIILNSVNNIDKAYEELAKYATVHSFLDNDEAGQRTHELVVSHYRGAVVNESARFRPFVDLNDYLVKYQAHDI